jgi:hypothetical protein
VFCGLLARVDEALEVRADERVELFRRVLDEGLREEDASVVHQHVHLTEALDRQGEQPLRGLWLADVALEHQQVVGRSEPGRTRCRSRPR